MESDKSIPVVKDGRQIIFTCDNCGTRIATNRLTVDCLKCGKVYEIIMMVLPKES